jgi:hypothetical protein
LDLVGPFVGDPELMEANRIERENREKERQRDIARIDRQIARAKARPKKQRRSKAA